MMSNRLLTVGVLCMMVLVASTALRNAVVEADTTTVLAGTTSPVPTTPWLTAGTTSPVPTTPWKGTTSPVPTTPWLTAGTTSPVPTTPWKEATNSGRQGL
jgi:hypothetical protein